MIYNYNKHNNNNNKPLDTNVFRHTDKNNVQKFS